MNVKFKMPKFGRTMTGGNMFKELLLTTLATTISIILTFGTAAWIEHMQKEKNRRLTAKMVISDIYAFKCNVEAYQNEYFINWKKNLEELQTLSRDSILRLTDEERKKYWRALSTPVAFTRDKTAENIFTSDISTWRDVGNFYFIRTVGNSYSFINDLESNIKAKMAEKGDNNKLFETNFDVEHMSDGEQLLAYMEMKEVKRFMKDFTEGFCPYIQGCIDDLQNKVIDCMKMMEISGEELNEFLSDRY